MTRERTYIILFDDGCLQFFTRKPNPDHFEPNIRIFKTWEHLPLYEIVAWVSKGWTDGTHIVEIT